MTVKHQSNIQSEINVCPEDYGCLVTLLYSRFFCIKCSNNIFLEINLTRWHM